MTGKGCYFRWGTHGRSSQEVKCGKNPEQSEGVNPVAMWGKDSDLNVLFLN